MRGGVGATHHLYGSVKHKGMRDTHNRLHGSFKVTAFGNCVRKLALDWTKSMMVRD